MLHPTKSTKKEKRYIPWLSVGVQVRQMGIPSERRQLLSV